MLHPLSHSSPERTAAQTVSRADLTIKSIAKQCAPGKEMSDTRTKHERRADEMKHEAEALRTVPFSALWKSHPKDEGARSLASARGGELAKVLDSLDAAHDSAIRLSIAFNEAGHFITESDAHSGKLITDATGGVYIRDAAQFKSLLTGRHGFGTPVHVTGKDIVRKLGKASGIIMFENVPSLAGASYIDLWHGAADSSDTATSLGHTYISEATRILFWALPEPAST